MVKPDIHKANLIGILKEIYSDPLLRSILGFKGGTAAMLFYDLPRLSVDLDFDLLDVKKKMVVYKKLETILPQFGELIEAQDKYYTLFFLVRYEKGGRNLKIEISKRETLAHYEPKDYLGISMLVMTQADMVASKLVALLTRSRFASRDLFDLWFFLKNNWEINEKVVEELSRMTLTDALKKAEEKVKTIKKTELLSGLGDLLDIKQKNWVKTNLLEELIFLITLYKS